MRAHFSSSLQCLGGALALTVLSALVTACSTPAAAPSGLAMIRPSAQRNTQSRTFSPQVVIREIDGRSLSPEEGEMPAVLKPGPHTIAILLLGQVGTTTGTVTPVPDVQTVPRFESQLSFVAEPDHTYRACVMDDGRGYRFWIEDDLKRRVVAGARDW